MPTSPPQRAVVVRLLLTLLVLGVGFGTTVGISGRVARSEADGRTGEDLALRAGAVGASIERYGSLVAGASAYFSRIDHDPAMVTDDDLRAYLEAVGGEEEYPDLLEGLDYIVRIHRDDIETFQARRQQSMPGFEVQTGSRQVYQAITWARSVGNGHGLLADDTAEQSTALDDATQRDRVRMTAPLAGAPWPADAPTTTSTVSRVVQVYAPVTSVDAELPLGWVAATLHIDDILPPTPADLPMALWITDNGQRVTGVPVGDERAGDHQLTLPVLGREWRMRGASTATPPDVPLLAMGSLLTLIAAVLVDRTNRSGRRLRSHAEEATTARDSYASLVDTVVAHVEVGIIACDSQGRITLTNEAAARILDGALVPDRGTAAPWLTEMPLRRAAGGEEVEDEEIVVNGEQGERTLLVSAHPLDNGWGEVTGAVATLHDITDRKVVEADLTRLAMQDHLTGLSNRRALAAALQDALDTHHAGGPSVTLLLMDLDGFKQVNDTVGHHRGDQMLVDVAAHLRSHIHDGDVAARIGGDEFVLLCPHQRTSDDAYRMASRVVDVLTPILVTEADIRSGVSIGVVWPPSDASVDDVLRFADLAMYEAKASSGTSVRMYRPEMDMLAADSHATEIALRTAAVDGSLRLALQPVVDVSTGRISSAEALVRWERDGQLLMPADFLPIAERSDLITQIDLWVLGEACRLAARPSMPDRVHINVSARTLALPDLVRHVHEALDAAGIPPSRLGMELTETTLISASALMDQTVASLVHMGVSVSLDDFGTGYASLNYLRRFPVDVIKIDREFVQGMVTNPADRGIVAGTVDLARRLGLRTVAEGVETAGQAALLVELGCDMLQGYLLGRPMGQDDLVRAHTMPMAAWETVSASD